MNGANNRVQVFVTHKSDDIEKVNKLIQILQIYDAAERLKFVLAEDMPKGEVWRQFIYKNVVEANVLFFLMVSPTVNWEWCIYEAGLFAGSKAEGSNRKIIVFFNPSQHSIPSPLEDLQAVKINQGDIEIFLQQFYGTTQLTGVEPPLNSNLAKNLSVIKDVAQSICALLTNND